MERKPILEVKSAKGRQVHAIIATLNHHDADGDIVKSGFFPYRPMGSQLIPGHAWTHIPLGRALTWEAGGVVKSVLTFNSTQAASEWFQAIADDFETGRPLQQYSWGFRPHEDAVTRTKSGRELHARRDGSPGIQLFEVSPVLVAASFGTQTTGIKSMDWASLMLARIRRKSWR